MGWVTGPYAVRKVAIQRRAPAYLPASRLRNDRRSNLEDLGFVAEAALMLRLLVLGVDVQRWKKLGSGEVKQHGKRLPGPVRRRRSRPIA